MPHHYAYHTWDGPYTGMYGGSKPQYSTRPASSQIYGHGLHQLELRTSNNIDQLRSTLCAIDPCYALAPDFWHFNQDNKNTVSSKEECPQHEKPKWENIKTIFTTQQSMKLARPRLEETETSEPVYQHCYLCTTLEEHRRHLARRGEQLKPKKKPRPRVNFIVPLPYVKRKEEDEEEENNVLYKVIVRTGTKPNAATSANVFIKLRGSHGNMKERPLCKKMCVKFAFGRGTSEVFHIRGPKIGRLKSLTVWHDGLEKVHSWWLNEIEVTDMAAHRTYIFSCHEWLSLHLGDRSVKRNLRAQEKEIKQIEYEVSITTAKERKASTSANVFLTLYSKKGFSPRQKLESKKESSFSAGETDNFNFVIDDVGPLTKIRLEQDNTGDNPDWKVEMVVIHDCERDKTYQFPCGQWLSSDEKRGGQLFRELFPIGRSMEKALKHARKGGSVPTGPLLTYEVTVVTGNRTYAGTDANVYLMMLGKLGKTSEVELDDHRNNFEKGMTEEFPIKAEDVGDLKVARIRHDDTGLGSGWFLEKIIIKRYFSKSEIAERMDLMEANLKDKVIEKAAEITGSPVHRSSSAASLKHRGSIRSDGSPDHNPRNSRPKSGYGRKSHPDSDSENEQGKDMYGYRKGRKSGADSDVEDEKLNSRKHRKKKMVSYKGIDVMVTDSENDEDSRNRKSPERTSGRHRQRKHPSESEDDEYRRQRGRRKIRFEDSDSENDRRKQKHNSRKVRYNSDSDTGEDRSFETKRGYRRKSKMESDSDSESDYQNNSHRKNVFTEYGEGRIPYCDEYIFPCHKWLATDEGDGQISRELKPKSVTTFYQVAK